MTNGRKGAKGAECAEWTVALSPLYNARVSRIKTGKPDQYGEERAKNAGLGVYSTSRVRVINPQAVLDL